MVWWCRTCGETVRDSVLVVRIASGETGGSKRHTYCSDECAELDRVRHEIIEDGGADIAVGTGAA